MRFDRLLPLNFIKNRLKNEINKYITNFSPTTDYFINELSDFDIYTFGGLVRNLYLKRNVNDIDIRVVGNNVLSYKKKIMSLIVKQKGLVLTSRRVKESNMFIIRCRYKDMQCDFSLIKTLDSYIEYTDFRVNTIFYDLRRKIFLDKYNGFRDLQNRQLTTIIDPEILIKKFPLYIFRGLRLHLEAGFTIYDDITSAIKKNNEKVRKQLISSLKHPNSYSTQGLAIEINRGYKMNRISYMTLIKNLCIPQEIIFQYLNLYNDCLSKT